MRVRGGADKYGLDLGIGEDLGARGCDAGYAATGRDLLRSDAANVCYRDDMGLRQAEGE
jgi:hypothetical protein